MRNDEKAAMEAVVERMLTNLENRADEMEGLNLEQLRVAMHEPGAVESVMTLSSREGNSVQQGERARDFSLPFLTPSEGLDGECMTLSSHFGKRPVGLIFGSYT
ncbi:hypothetical protein MK489_22210 [Myxococcota bacterium]|nr:hypothetical protein [Myxococcota bacterium]